MTAKGAAITSSPARSQRRRGGGDDSSLRCGGFGSTRRESRRSIVSSEIDRTFKRQHATASRGEPNRRLFTADRVCVFVFLFFLGSLAGARSAAGNGNRRTAIVPTAKPFWFDECFSVVGARLSWANFLRLLWWREANMSLYYVLLRIWLGVCPRSGQSEFFIRSLSVAIDAFTLRQSTGWGDNSTTGGWD